MLNYFNGGALAVVAHADDDLLFMNPDILTGIDAGAPSATVYVTAGDAGEGPAYWQSREAGAKAAYAEMAGVSGWVDDTLSLTVGETTFDIATSYLADKPAVRLYFLRLPDGAGVLEEGQEQQLARLANGTLSSVTTVDDSATYTRADLVAVLSHLMTLHRPSDLLLQQDDWEEVTRDHTDHISATVFAEEAAAQNIGSTFQVTQYVQYDSGDLSANLSQTVTDRVRDVFDAYAQHDPYVFDETGAYLPDYTNWTARQYIASTRTEDTTLRYSLAGSDAAAFQIDPVSGQITLALAPGQTGWPADQDGDGVFSLTRIGQAADGGIATTEAVDLRALTDSILAQAALFPTGSSGRAERDIVWETYAVVPGLGKVYPGEDAGPFGVTSADGAAHVGFSDMAAEPASDGLVVDLVALYLDLPA